MNPIGFKVVQQVLKMITPRDENVEDDGEISDGLNEESDFNISLMLMEKLNNIHEEHDLLRILDNEDASFNKYN